MSKQNDNTNKILSNILFVILLALCLGVLFYIGYDYKKSVDKYSIQLEQTVKSRDEQIKHLENLNKIYKENLSKRDITDSLKIDYTEFNREFVVYANELSDKLIESYKRLNMLQDSLRYYKIYYNYSQEKFNHKYIVKQNASGGRNYSFKPNAVTNSIYESCIEQRNTFQTELYKVQRELDVLKEALKKYDIKIKERKIEVDEDSYATHYKFFSPKVDSALMLLPIYRDKMKYNEKNEEWSIGGKNTIKTYFKDSPDYVIGTISTKNVKIIYPDSNNSDSIP